MHAVFKVRSEPTDEAWLAAIFARNRLGMAMAAIIRIIATTINSSINEKPFCLLRIEFVSSGGTRILGCLAFMHTLGARQPPCRAENGYLFGHISRNTLEMKALAEGTFFGWYSRADFPTRRSDILRQ